MRKAEFYMGLFSNKNNQFIAAQDLKIVQDCVHIINSTKKPNIFFERYDLMEQKLNNLIHLSGVHYSGTSPRQMLKQVTKKKQAAIHDMIDRYFNDISFKAASLKTEKAKQNTYNTFLSTLELFFPQMDANNITYIKQLYEKVSNK